jgi:hypothetical protein
MNKLNYDVQLYKKIGCFTINFQYFEVAFAILVKLVFGQHLAGEGQLNDPINTHEMKKSTKRLLEELDRRINVDSDFSSKLHRLIDKRNIIIHRLVADKKWPKSSNVTSQQVLLRYVHEASNDTNAFSRLFIKYITEWTDKFPETKGILNKLDSDWMNCVPEHIKILKIES